MIGVIVCFKLSYKIVNKTYFSRSIAYGCMTVSGYSWRTEKSRFFDFWMKNLAKLGIFKTWTVVKPKTKPV